MEASASRSPPWLPLLAFSAAAGALLLLVAKQPNASDDEVAVSELTQGQQERLARLDAARGAAPAASVRCGTRGCGNFGSRRNGGKCSACDAKDGAAGGAAGAGAGAGRRPPPPRLPPERDPISGRRNFACPCCAPGGGSSFRMSDLN